MSNLLQKASIVTTPTAYGVGVLNSIKPAYALGENLVINGTFDTDSDWTKAANWNISGGKANTNGSGLLYQTGVSYVDGFKYEVTFTANITSGNGTVRLGNTSSATTFANGFNKLVLQTALSNTTKYIFFQANSMVGTIDNVSVKLITDADFQFSRTSSATRVNPDYLIETVSINSANLVQNGNFSELGAEAVTNGDFATDSDWTKTQATIQNGQAIITSPDGSYAAIYQSGILTSGKTYYYSVNVKSISGTMQFVAGSGTNIDVTTTGVKTGYITANGTTIFEIKRKSGAGAFSATIDNVSVKQVDPNDEWSKINSTISDKGNLNGTGVTSLLYQDILTDTKTYQVAFTVSNYNGLGEARIIDSSGSALYTITSNGTFTFTFTHNQVSGNFLFRARTNAIFSVDNISVIEIQENGVPRLDYTNGTASILLEPQSTNLFTYSQDFSNAAWTKTGSATITTNTTISPDGTQNADTLSLLVGNYFYESISSGAGTFTISCYVRVTSGTLDFKMQSFTPSVGANASSVFTANTEWQRFEFTTTVTANSNFYPVFIDAPLTGGVFEIWGAQLEAQSFSTSLIHTSGSTVTRAAESLNNAANSDLINSTEGVLYCEIAALADDLTARRLSLSDNTTSNVVEIGYTNVSNEIKSRVKSSGSTVANMNYVVSNISSYLKIALKYKANDFALWINGVEVATDTSGAVPIGLSELSFDRGDATQLFYGNCKTVAVFKEALSDTELACLTSTNNREIFLNYYYRMQYVGANTEALSCAEQTFNI